MEMTVKKKLLVYSMMHEYIFVKFHMSLQMPSVKT